MWVNFKTNCFRTRFTFIWNKIVLLYIKQYLSNSFAPTVPASVIRSPYEIRTHYYKLPFVGPFSTNVQHRIKRLTQCCCKNLVIKLVFDPYKIKNLFSAKDAISNLSPSLVVYKFSCAAPVMSAYGKAAIRNPEPEQETETEPELKLRVNCETLKPVPDTRVGIKFKMASSVIIGFINF